MYLGLYVLCCVVWFPWDLVHVSVPAWLLLDQVRDLCEFEKMNIKKILLRWLIVTIKYFMVNVAVASLLDILVFRPLEVWLGMEGTDNMEDMENIEDVETMEIMEDPLGMDGDRAVTEG